ncbi:MAG: flagellar motor protein MotB [Bacteroidetes bacterium]|jgi:outer membrane protein OmpA-like peptidoglycan-associated protein/tetratricopeptide (TPR) repeat protein|nr:flagellar motor protein MotB [Bacteroidota bacterium]MDF2451544.1 flagellar motor protein MotB [Bacteroidota bacterium]
MRKNNFFITSLLLVSLGCFGQMKKAEKHFTNFNYAKAIPVYEKVAKGNSADRQKAMIKLADCHRILNNYAEAESYYAKAIGIGKVPSEVNYNYGNVLKSNNKYTEALTQYSLFLAENQNSATTKNAIKSCQEIKFWESKPKEYEVKNMEAINTKRSEFSPFVLNNQLIFVGEKVADIVDFEKSATNNQPFLDIFSAEIKNNELKKEKLLSKKINSSYHDGPITFSADGKTAAYTRVNYIVNKKDKNFINRAKIYFSEVKGKSFSKPKSFVHNSDDYSCAHPTLSADGNTLYFSSDMPGTLGGQDIWMCRKNGENWDKPVNLGFDINTSGDEVFPSVKKDGTLFFSSNGLPGFGDLDIFSAKQVDGKWLLNRNEGLYLNSKADDFGITFLNDSIGYFSSNREGGKGEDDIYYYKFTNKNISVDGIVLLTENVNDPAKNVKVYLLDGDSKALDSTLTNEIGYFVFRDLDADKTYMAEIEGTEANLKNKSRYYLADKDSKITRITHNGGSGQKFVFKNLPVDPNGMPDLYNDDDLSLAGNLLYGENPSKPIANKKVIIKNEYGDIVEETTTNEFGAFAFRNLPLDQNYSITVVDDDMPVNAKIIMTSKSGKEVKVARSDSKGNFKFSLLAVDKSAISDLNVDDKDLIMNLNGYLYDQDKKAISNARVTIFNKNEVIENIITDSKGKFTFKNLGTDQNYLFSIDDSDPRMKSVTKVYVADAKGRIYREINRDAKVGFQFSLIEVDKTAMGEYSVEDPWLEVLSMKNKEMQKAITIIESLYYAYGDYEIDAAGQNILDKVITVLNSNKNLNMEISSHTDSRSSSEFNMSLSQKRARAAVDYIISKGVSRSRLKAVGYGETRLLNKCKNDADCTEEEHAKNRRTEFKIVEVGKL